MVAFIKRRKDFKTYTSAEVVSYDVPLASIEDDVGTIILYNSTVTRGSEGDFLIMDGHIWVIDQVAAVHSRRNDHRGLSGEADPGALPEYQ